MPRQNPGLKQKFAQAPLDLVRNPNFDSAMAQQNYQNSIAGMKAKIDAERAGILSKQGLQEGGGQRPSDRFDDYRGQRQPQGGGGPDFIQEDPNRKYTDNMVDYIDPATGERTSRTRGVVPALGSRFVPANKAGMYVQIPPPGPQANLGKYGFPERDPRSPDTQYGGEDPELKLPPQGLQAGGGMGGLASQQPGRLIEEPGMRIPQGKQQQMQSYQNFLKQGMQNSNALNQGATGSFANMQPGMQATQTASTAPRKFSITSNPQVKAF
jgi:hypothetical protein